MEILKRGLNSIRNSVNKQSFKMVNSGLFEKIKAKLHEEKSMDLTLYGNSMEPVILNGDRAVLEAIEDIKLLKRFDILVFWSHDRLFCHYLWHMNKNFNLTEKDVVLQTRPLNPLGCYDWPVFGSQLLGRVQRFSIPLKLKLKIYFKTFLSHKH
jgi:hypothetical protein